MLPLLAIAGTPVWCVYFVDWHRHTIDVNCAKREYLLYKPKNNDGEPKPLMLALHGFGDDAARMAMQSQLHELAREKGFYLVYLEGDNTWQFFTPPDKEVSNDIVYFDRVCEELIARHPIDTDRIYVVGMSRGGDFTMRLAEHRSDRIAAVVSQGACAADIAEMDRPLPVMFIVGTKDDRVPPEHFPVVPDMLRERGHTVEVIRPEGVGHWWHVPSNERMWRFLSSHHLHQKPVTKNHQPN